MATAVQAGFTGFGPQALAFFKALSFHQNKAWFDENRELYETQVKAPFELLLTDLTHRFAASAIPLRADPKKAIFRLHRDVRFTREKHPYKTHAGAVLTRDGTKASPGLLYVHLDPQGSFLGAGFYRAEPPTLDALRQAVQRRPESWLATLARLAETGLEPSLDGSMKRLPRGFESFKGGPLEPAFKLRSFVTFRPLAEPLLFEPGLVPTVEQFARDALPLLEFGWQALAERRA
jgi:uncharacterized protein (TIGR02453 family)